jgi:EAL domain-containing protein (putative c-di-GMP-specific phosphodiesterase class I)
MGKELQPQNALPPRHAGSSGPAAEAATAEALGWQLRAALPPIRLHSVSLYDSQGNVLWLSEGALGPDEHSLVADALDRLAGESGKSCCENRLEDGRIAVFLAARAPQGHLVGLAMVLADLKSGGEGWMDRILTASTRTLMQKLAVLLRPAGPRRPDTDPTALVLSLAAAEGPHLAAEAPVAAAPAPPPQAGATRKGSPHRTAAEELTPRAVNDILEFDLTDAPILRAAPQQRAGSTQSSPALTPPAPAVSTSSVSPAPPVSPAPSATGHSRILGSPAAADSGTARAVHTPSTAGTGSGRPLASAASGGSVSQGASDSASGPQRRALALDPALVSLEMLPFVKLRAGGRTRRFEVLPTGTARELRDPAVLDALAVRRLCDWLANHRAAWTAEPTSFTLNLSIATLEDERFLKHFATALQNHGIAPDAVGFEIAEALCTQRRAQVEHFMAGCDQIGCFVIIDDFSFDSAVVPLLRSKALRLVKIDSRLTAGALRDKLSQALVVAIVQAVKVLGMHCAAQRVDSQAALQWLTAVGCDFAQGPMLARQQPLTGLLGAASP